MFAPIRRGVCFAGETLLGICMAQLPCPHAPPPYALSCPDNGMAFARMKTKGPGEVASAGLWARLGAYITRLSQRPLHVFLKVPQGLLQVLSQGFHPDIVRPLVASDRSYMKRHPVGGDLD